MFLLTDVAAYVFAPLALSVVFAMTHRRGRHVLRRHGCFSINREGHDVRAFRQAVEVLEPFTETGDAATLAALGIALSDAGRHAEGEQVLRKLVAQDDSDPKAHENLGIVLLDRLPWKTEWIRLPWMQAPMRVEW